jgi:hypothetical protein
MRPKNEVQSPATDLQTTECEHSPHSHLVLPPQFSRRIFFVSHLTLFSSLLAGYLEVYDCACLALLVYLTSVNYWRLPTKGFRRTFDMCAVAVGFAHHLYRALLDSSVHVIYVVLFSLCVFCYGKARQRSSHSKDESSWWHCGIHVFGNVGNVVLYLSIAAEGWWWRH